MSAEVCGLLHTIILQQPNVWAEKNREKSIKEEFTSLKVVSLSP